MGLFYLFGIDVIYLLFYFTTLSWVCFDFYKKVIRDDDRFHKWIANYNKDHLKKDEQIREYMEYKKDTYVNIREIERNMINKIKVE
jgi:hypothetical protein